MMQPRGSPCYPPLRAPRSVLYHGGVDTATMFDMSSCVYYVVPWRARPAFSQHMSAFRPRQWPYISSHLITPNCVFYCTQGQPGRLVAMGGGRGVM